MSCYWVARYIPGRDWHDGRTAISFLEMDDLPKDPIHTADPRASYLAHKAEINAAIQSVLDQPQHILGPVVERFEAQFARFVGVSHGVGVNSGTDALHLALRALDVGPGDEVITTSHTAVATVAAIEMSGAAPVLVDVELPWLTIDPAAAAGAIGPSTKAIIAVHLYGQPADLTGLRALCDRHGLALVEDCAQAHGARWEGAAAGSFGSVGCFSFYPTKNLGTVGDGGMVVTDDEALANRVAMLRQYGWSETGESLFPGWNSRLGPLEAAILAVKIRYLPAMVGRRRQIAREYDGRLSRLGLHLPRQRERSEHAYHLYVVRCEDSDQRDGLVQHLAARRIQAGVHYPVPVHLQSAYRDRVDARSLPNTEAAARQVVSLPVYPELSTAQQQAIVSGIGEFFGAPL
jgi:dTDP-4-amino-4,6-dideoxygalactose transaminase